MDTRRARRACWNLRWAGLFLAGPVAGFVPLALIFGMSAGMVRVAMGMVVFTAALFGILIKGEYDRLSHLPRR